LNGGHAGLSQARRQPLRFQIGVRITADNAIDINVATALAACPRIGPGSPFGGPGPAVAALVLFQALVEALDFTARAISGAR
jgi:hypothetical protein